MPSNTLMTVTALCPDCGKVKATTEIEKDQSDPYPSIELPVPCDPPCPKKQEKLEAAGKKKAEALAKKMAGRSIEKKGREATQKLEELLRESRKGAAAAAVPAVEKKTTKKPTDNKAADKKVADKKVADQKAADQKAIEAKAHGSLH